LDCISRFCKNLITHIGAKTINRREVRISARVPLLLRRSRFRSGRHKHHGPACI
jgi:hypothetical protein